MFKRLILILNLVYFVNAQTTNLEELSNAYITSIAKDKLGRIWFGTKSGLFSYDGYDVYKFNSSKQYISNDQITGVVFNDKINKLVITTVDGVNFFDTDSLKNQKVFIVPNSTNNEDNHVLEPHIDSIGNVWCSNMKGRLIKINPSKKVLVYTISVSIPLNLLAKYNYKDQLNQITTHGNKVYFSTRAMLCAFTEKDKSTKIESYDHRAISGIFLKGKTALIFDFNGIHSKQIGDSSDVLVSKIHLINSAYMDNEGDIWFIVNTKQLYKLGSNNEPELIFELDAEKINKYKAINCVYIDKTRICLGTNRGFILINKPLVAFKKIFENLTGYTSFELSSRGITKRNDTTIICAGYNYFARYNPNSGSTHTLISKEGAKQLIPYSLEITGDSLWIATEGTGIRLMDLTSNQFKNITYKNKPPKEYFAYGGLIKFVKKIDSVLFLCEYGLMGAYHLKSKLITDCDLFKWRYPTFNDKARGVNQILELNSNELAFVAKGKLIITNRNFKIKDLIRLTDDDKDNSSQAEIINIMQDKNNKLWLSTINKGVCCYDREKRVGVWYNTNNGLSDNTAYYSMQSNDGRVWVATNYGLNVIDLTTKKIKRYFESDGLANNEFNTNSFFKDSGGDLYFGGMKGVTRIIPSKLITDNENDVLKLTAIEMAGQGRSDSVVISNLNSIEKINLPFDSRYLRVRFSLMNFSQKNRYQFRLKGMDSSWVDLGNSNSVVFNSLIPGNYTLEVKAWNERGDLLPGSLSLPIVSEQVFYRKIWFIVFLVLMIIVSIAFIFYIAYTLKVKSINQIAEMRLRIATDLHDQVGGLLNKTATQAEMVQMKLAGKDDLLIKISDNSRVALNSMRDILWNLDPRNDTPESLIDRMSEYAHKMMEDTNIYELDLNELKQAKLSNEIRQTIITVFKESITNIVKHASGEKVKVSTTMNDKTLKLTVHSTGNFIESQTHAGQGIRNMKMRIEKIGGTLEVDKSEGVRIIFNIPAK